MWIHKAASLSSAVLRGVQRLEALLQGRLDILQQAPLSSVLPTPIWCYHLQQETKSAWDQPQRDLEHRSTPYTLTTHGKPERPVPLRDEETQPQGNTELSQRPQLLCAAIAVLQIKLYFFKGSSYNQMRASIIN